MKILAATTLILWALTVAAAFYVDKYRPFDARFDAWLQRSTLVALVSTAVLCVVVLV